jgi:hypothetical protein
MPSTSPVARATGPRSVRTATNRATGPGCPVSNRATSITGAGTPRMMLIPHTHGGEPASGRVSSGRIVSTTSSRCSAQSRAPARNTSDAAAAPATGSASCPDCTIGSD